MICGIFTSILELPKEDNDVLNAEHFGTGLLCSNLPEGAFYMLVTLAQPSFSSRQAGCSNYRQQRPNLFLKSSLKSVKLAEGTSL